MVLVSGYVAKVGRVLGPKSDRRHQLQELNKSFALKTRWA